MAKSGYSGGRAQQQCKSNWWIDQVLNCGELPLDMDHLPKEVREATSKEWAMRVLFLNAQEAGSLEIQTIERHFRQVALHVHPDKHEQSPAATQAQKVVLQARAILKQRGNADSPAGPRGTERADQEENDWEAAMKKSKEMHDAIHENFIMLDSLISSRGSTRWAVKPDGHCQFRSLFIGLLHLRPRDVVQASHTDLRTVVCDWMSKNRHATTFAGITWMESVDIELRELRVTEPECPQNFDEYIEDMRDLTKKYPTWGHALIGPRRA